MLRSLAFACVVLSSLCVSAIPTPTVDCGAGQSLNQALAKLSKFSPVTVTFKGTCTEYVQIDGFNGLTLKGVQGATIQQPDTPPPTNPGFVLSVKASRSITFSGFAVHSAPAPGLFSGIGIGKASSDVLLQDVVTDGVWGVVIYESSQVWLLRLTVNITSGYAAVAVYDKSDVHIVDGLLKRPSNGNFNAGISVGSGHVTMQGMTIRDMQQGIAIGQSGSVDLVNFDPAAAGTDVIIDNPSGTNFNGVIVSDGSSLNVESAKLRINNPGQPFGGDTGGIFVSNGSTLDASAGNLVVSGSQAQGVVVSNDSHAQLTGSTITGSAHGGLVVVNLSTVNNGDFTGVVTIISGNGTDVFCDSKSRITGAFNIANAVTVQCNDLVPGPYENLP